MNWNIEGERVKCVKYGYCANNQSLLNCHDRTNQMYISYRESYIQSIKEVL